MNTRDRVKEIDSLLGEAEHWRGQCHYQSPEAEAIEKLIQALKLTSRLILDCAFAASPGDR